MATTRPTFADRAKQAGCWAIGLYIIAAFFAFGMLISMLNADILTALQALILTALFAAGGWWLARRNAQG